ncbi:MAG TPA: hypothetical protein VJQ58_00175 [Burkholderiales bacterium]|nr:hypothetical protein [Burkholderiales bacterium]
MAHAQVQTTTTTVAPALEVQRLAPQLVGFAGSDLNFANLVNGLAFGVPVTLTTPLVSGGTQIFTFTPTGALTSVQIAQVLEQARQLLIARGVATPTAQQLGTTLTGGALATASGTTPVNALVNTVTTATPSAAAGATGTTTQSPAAAIQNANSAANAANSAAGSSAPRNMSDSPLPRGISDTPPLPVPGVTTPPTSTPTTEAPRLAPPITPAAPIAPALAAPAVRTGDR